MYTDRIPPQTALLSRKKGRKTCWGFKISVEIASWDFCCLLCIHFCCLIRWRKIDQQQWEWKVWGVLWWGKRGKNRKRGGVQSTRIGTQGATFLPEPQITGASLGVLWVNTHKRLLCRQPLSWLNGLFEIWELYELKCAVKMLSINRGRTWKLCFYSMIHGMCHTVWPWDLLLLL